MFKNLSKISLIIILLVSLFIRLYNLDYPISYIFAWGDGTRDYYVADHIVRYKEFPLLGPYNLLNEIGIYNSPIYFYLLALFLIPFNHVLTLGVVNIIFQIFTIILIFLISKKLFDEKTAILSILIFSFNPEILFQSDYIWQPYLSQFFAYLSLLLFLYNQKVLSALSLAFSFSLHNSSFPWIPLFFTATLRPSVLAYFFIFLSVLYIPVGLHISQNPQSTTFTHSLSIHSIYDYSNNFKTNLEGLLKAFNINNFWILITIFLSAIYFLRSKDKKQTKIMVAALLILIFSPIFFASFFNKFRLHYLTLSLGVFTIYLAKIYTSFPKLRILSLIVILFLLKTVTFDFRFLSFEKEPLENLKIINDLSEEIINQVKDPSSFQIKSYSMDDKIFEYPTLDTIFIIPLEDKLKTKLGVLDDKSPFNHHQTGGKEYFIVACHDFHFLSRWDSCLNTFTVSYPTYAILKNLYTGESFSLYLTKHD